MHQFPEWETHLVISKGAEKTIELETSYTLDQVKQMATKVYSNKNIGANIAMVPLKLKEWWLYPVVWL